MQTQTRYHAFEYEVYRIHDQDLGLWQDSYDFHIEAR